MDRFTFHLRNTLVGIIVVGLIATSVQYTIKSSDERSAFVRWRPQLQELGEGVDIYDKYIYPNAPMMALILFPMAHLPRIEMGSIELDLGAQLWFFLKLAMTVQAFVWIFRMIESPGRSFPMWAKLGVIFLSARPILGDLMHGNVNLLIMFLTVATLYAYYRGRDVLSGVILGLGIVCKVTPALFLPYFLWKRAWKTLAGCLLGLFLFFLIVPSAFLGPERNWNLLNGWIDGMIKPFVVENEVTTEQCNQSLPGLMYRMLTHSPSFLDSEDKPKDYHNFADMNPDLVRLALKGLGVGFLLFMAWCCRTPTQPRGNWLLAAEYSIIILGMLVFSERTWKHHHVTMMVPFSVLTYYLGAMQPSRAWRNYVIAVLASVMLLMAATSTSIWEPFGYRIGAKLAQVYGAYVWADLLLVGTMGALLVKYRGQPKKGQESIPEI